MSDWRLADTYVTEAGAPADRIANQLPVTFRCSDPEGDWIADLEADYEAQAADKADHDRDLQNAEADRDEDETPA